MRSQAQTWPDVELLVVEWIRAGLPGVTVGTKVPAGGGSSVRVQRVGGFRAQVHDVARVLVEVRADGDACWDLTTDVRDLLRRLPGQHDEGVVNGVEETGGPANLPDPITGQPRYTLTVVARVKPVDEPAST